MSEKSSWMPSLNALRAFDAVARLGSFQKAADELHVSSPAVQQLVRSLEDAVGQSLIVRKSRSISLSAAALSALPPLRSAFENMEAAVNQMRTYARAQGIKISVEPSFAAGWLLHRLSDFQRRHPDIDVFVDASVRLVDLDRDADIALRYTTPGGGNYIARLLFEDETVAVCAPALLNAVAELVSRPHGDQHGLMLIHFEIPRETLLQPDWKAWTSAAGISMAIPAKGLRFSDYTMVLQSAIAGNGVALASLPLVRDALRSGLLVDAFAKGVRNGFGYYLVSTAAAEQRPEVVAFIDWLVEVAALDDPG